MSGGFFFNYVLHSVVKSEHTDKALLNINGIKGKYIPPFSKQLNSGTVIENTYFLIC